MQLGRVGAVALGSLVLGVGLALAEEPSPQQRELASRLQHELEAIRGQKIPREIKLVRKTPDDLRAVVDEELSDSLPVEGAKVLSRAFGRFGLIPAGYDLRAVGLEIATADTAASYDRKSQVIMLVQPELSEDALSPALFESFAYALQYQRHDMDRFFDDGTWDVGDELFARRFVSEGEANYLEHIRDARTQQSESAVPDVADNVASMTRAELSELQRRQALAAGEAGKRSLAFNERAARFPAYVYHSTFDPAIKGAATLGKIVRTSGWAAVDELWKRPPTSTAQLLHWHKVVGEREEPIRIALPDLAPALGAGAKRRLDRTVGELGVRCLLEELGVPEREAAALARGWRGDRLAAWEKDGAAADGSETTCAWLGRWETDEGARRLYETLRPLLEKRSQGKCAGSLSERELSFVVSSSDRLAALAQTVARDSKKTAPAR